MKTPIELQVEIEGKVLKVQFALFDQPTPEPYVQLPALDEQRRMMNTQMRARFKAMGMPLTDIPAEPFVNAYALSDLKKDLSLISKSNVHSSVESEKLVLSLLETLVDWHVGEYGRLFRTDLEGYATVCVMLAFAYLAQDGMNIATSISFGADPLWDVDEQLKLYEQACLAVRERHFEVYIHNDLIQLQ